MSLLINPVIGTPHESGVLISPEVMVIFPELSSEFEYIHSLIGDWDHYVSSIISTDAISASVDLTVLGGEGLHKGSICSAYIYGWKPKSPEWSENSCIAVVFFDVPSLIVPSEVLTCTLTVTLDGAISFFDRKTVGIMKA